MSAVESGASSGPGQVKPVCQVSGGAGGDVPPHLAALRLWLSLQVLGQWGKGEGPGHGGYSGASQVPSQVAQLGMGSHGRGRGAS